MSVRAALAVTTAAVAFGCGAIVDDPRTTDAAFDTPADRVEIDARPRCTRDSDCVGPAATKLCHDGLCCNGFITDGRCGCGGDGECSRGSSCCPATTTAPEHCQSTVRSCGF